MKIISSQELKETIAKHDDVIGYYEFEKLKAEIMIKLFRQGFYQFTAMREMEIKEGEKFVKSLSDAGYKVEEVKRSSMDPQTWNIHR